MTPGGRTCISPTGMWLNESERGISYSKMSSLIAERKKIVSDVGFSQEDVWDSHSWDETQQIIRELQQSSSGGSLPSSSSSSTPPSSSSTTSQQLQYASKQFQQLAGQLRQFKQSGVSAGQL